MKTLEEVKKYLFDVGHNEVSIPKIEGFLLGVGILGDEFEMDYAVGDNDFESFKDWFEDNQCKKNIADDEFGYGDFMHVQKGVNVICLSKPKNGQFVGTDGVVLQKFFVTDETRPCSEEELDEVVADLNVGGIDFDFVDNEFCTCDGCKLNLKKKLDSDGIDLLEIYSKKAIENIIASIHSGELENEEYDCVLQAMMKLVELGEMYE